MLLGSKPDYQYWILNSLRAAKIVTKLKISHGITECSSTTFQTFC